MLSALKYSFCYIIISDHCLSFTLRKHTKQEMAHVGRPSLSLIHTGLLLAIVLLPGETWFTTFLQKEVCVCVTLDGLCDKGGTVPWFTICTFSDATISGKDNEVFWGILGIPAPEEVFTLYSYTQDTLRVILWILKYKKNIFRKKKWRKKFKLFAPFIIFMTVSKHWITSKTSRS